MMEKLFLYISFALVFLFAKNLAIALQDFYSNYPFLRLAPKSQLKLNPNYLRIGSVILIAVVFLR